VKTTKNI